jgi:hypothetical protein
MPYRGKSHTKPQKGVKMPKPPPDWIKKAAAMRIIEVIVVDHDYADVEMVRHHLRGLRPMRFKTKALSPCMVRIERLS